MRKIIILLSLISIVFLGCKEKSVEVPLTDNQKEEVILNEAPEIILEEKSKPVFFDYTSTGCPGCGSWGAPTFETISKELKNDIVPMAIHIKYQDPMITNASNAIADNRTGQKYTPQLWVNTTNAMVLSGNSIDGSGSITAISDEIKLFQSSEPSVAVGVSHAFNDSVMTIRYKLKVLDDIVGEYWIGLYVMENGILHQQSSGANNPFEHNHVIRVSNNEGFGEMLNSEDLTRDNHLEATVNIALDETWVKENIYATAIVWKKEGSNYVVVNANNNLFY